MEGIYLVIVSLVISVGLFLIFRGIVLWYWRIDKMVTNQNRMNDLLEAILNELKKPVDDNGSSSIERAQPEIEDSFFLGKTVTVIGPFKHTATDKVKQDLATRKAIIENDITNKTDLIVYGDLISSHDQNKIRSSGLTAISEIDFRKKYLDLKL